jgi:hypothetical protein
LDLNGFHERHDGQSPTIIRVYWQAKTCRGKEMNLAIGKKPKNEKLEEILPCSLYYGSIFGGYDIQPS